MTAVRLFRHGQMALFGLSGAILIYGGIAQAASPAAFSTFDATQGGCKDSPNGVNCNHYVTKADVYLSGGPEGAALADGSYFFAILTPGHQNDGFADGAAGNLSDTTAGGTTGDQGSGDAQSNRTFQVSGGVLSYTGTHKLGTDPQGHPVIQAAPFDDTDDPGNNYILAICSVGATSASDCKYDEFQVIGNEDGGSGGAVDAGPVDQPPVALCQSLTACANSACQFSGSIDNGSYDPDGQTVTLSQSPAAPYTLGTTAVTLSASDGTYSASCGATATVNDCTPPQITCPSPVTAQCTGNSQATVSMPNATATDNCVTPTISQPGTQTYSLGSTNVGYTAVDSSGNASSCSTAVTVVDTIPPTIACPAPVKAECTGHAQAFVTPGPASASDTCSSVSVAQAPAKAYPLGTTALPYSATDTSGNTSACASAAIVVDTTPPTITCPAPVTAQCTGNEQALVDPGQASATDSCTTAIVTDPGVGSYPLGTSDATHYAQDLSGNASMCLSQVTVIDTIPPTITCPAPITAECTGNGEAQVDTGNAQASDICSPVTVTDPSPAYYALGSSEVTHSASDISGNMNSCQGEVTVVDTIPPTITCPASVSAECTGNNEAFVSSGYASATDICTVPTVSDPPAQYYPLGTTSATHTATDQSGNQAACMNNVSVVDTTPPQVTVSGGPTLWPPDHKYVLVGLDQCGIAVNDRCNGALTLSQSGAAIAYVTSDEVVESTGVGSGHTLADIVIVDSTHVNLRAERQGTGDGRVYTIHFKAGDLDGNWATAACQVTVPHDQSPGEVAIDSGVKYTVYP